MENDYFIDQTTNKAYYQNWGAAPALKPAKENFKKIDMPFDSTSVYQKEFRDKRGEQAKFIKEGEVKMKKECMRKMQKGSLASTQVQPFYGKSQSHQTFKNPGMVKVKQHRPVDEVRNLTLDVRGQYEACGQE